MRQRDKLIRQQWMAAYEMELVRLIPEVAGKVDWNAATYFFNQGEAARDAAARMATRWKDHDNA